MEEFAIGQVSGSYPGKCVRMVELGWTWDKKKSLWRKEEDGIVKWVFDIRWSGDESSSEIGDESGDDIEEVKPYTGDIDFNNEKHREYLLSEIERAEQKEV